MCANKDNAKWRSENPEKAKESARESAKKWQAENLERAKENSAKWRSENPERVKENAAKWRSENREKASETAKKWQAENPKRAKENSAKWRTDNREKAKETAKKWRDENPERAKKWRIDNRESRNAHKKERRENDPLYKLSDNIRTLMLASFRKNGYKKNSKTTSILGCSFENFKSHLESLFTEGMTWSNQGSEWHIDHFIPLSGATSEAEIYRLNHYSNLRPLRALYNLSKGGNMPFKIVDGEIIPFLECDADYIANRVKAIIENLPEITEEALIKELLEESICY
jgi:hypothetical protein